MLLLTGCGKAGQPESTNIQSTPTLTPSPLPSPTTFVPKPKEPAELTEETINRMRNTKLRIEFGGELQLKSWDRDIEAYYGAYNGCVVIYTGPAASGWLDGEVDGVVFVNDLNGISAWKNDVFYRLQDAYARGLLTLDDVKSISYYHAAYNKSILA